MDKPSILIVDDDHAILTTLRKALETFAYAIDTADTGSLACKMIERNSYDCFLLDLRLPDLDGLEILRRYNLRNVIMITAHGNVENAVSAMKLGCVDYLSKPFDLDVIRATVNNVLMRKNLAYEQGLQYESLLELTKLDIQNRQYTQAIGKIKQALEIKPNSSEAYNLLGALHEVMDDLNLALTAYKQALNIDPSNDYARENLNRLRDLDNSRGIKLGF